MSDLFISYRREDGGWAGRLYGDLEQVFDVFFDTNRNKIDYGDVFPQRLDEALAECRVCLAVIGPEWASEKNLKRLANPNDWVRREIETSLAASTRMRTVPVFAGKAGVPDASALPASLQPLFLHNGADLTNENWKSDCKQLIERANGWLKGQVPPRIPAMLPYLCDRVAQQDDLIDLIRTGTTAQPIYACVVHGHKLEFHGSFLDRLRYRRVLEDLFNARGIGVACCMLQWNREKARAGRYADVLRRALKSEGMQRPAAMDADLLGYLRSLAQPLVAVVQVTWSDYQFCGSAIVPGLIDAWQALFVEAAQVTGASRVSTMPALLWINVTYDSDEQSLDDADKRLISVMLPRLEPVTQGDIADWLAIDEVKRATAGYEARLLALTDDPQCCVATGKVRMQHFVDNVRRIVALA
jgi:hypothetical protein